MTMNKFKIEFLNTLFETRVCRYKQSNHKKYVDTKIIVTNVALNNYFNNLYTKYENKYNKNKIAFLTDCIFFTQEAIKNFEIKDNGTWKGMIDRSDNINVSRCITSIKSHVKHGMKKLNYDGYETTKMIKVNGKKERYHVWTSIQFESIEKLLLNKDDEHLKKEIVESQNYWQKNSGYKLDSFLAWVQLNKERILTASQIDFINRLEAIDFVEERRVMSNSQIKKAIGCSACAVNNKMKKIEQRLWKAWLKERKFYSDSFATEMIQKQINMLYVAMDIVENEEDDLFTQNKRLSNYVKANIDNPSIEHIIYEILTDEQQAEVIYAFQNKTDIISEVLYVIFTAIENEISRLELALIKERDIHERNAKEREVKRPENFTIPEHGKTIYLTINAYGTHEQN